MLKTKKQLILFSILALLLLHSCGNKENAAMEEATEVTGAATDSVTETIDSVEVDGTAVQVDTTAFIIKKNKNRTPANAGLEMAPWIKKPKPQPAKTKGTIVSYCPEKMIEETPNIVSVTISKKDIEEAKVAVVKRLSGSDKKITEKDLTTTPVFISRKMKVKLFYKDTDFDLAEKPENEILEFDGENDLNWDWVVIPKQIKTLSLSFKITAYDSVNDKWVESGPPIILKTSVKVDPRSYISNLWTFFKGKPEWLLTQLLFPVVGYFVGRRNSKTTEG